MPKTIKCKCDYCGKEITKNLREYTKSEKHFCNRECYYNMKHEDLKAYKCTYCGKVIQKYVKSDRAKKYKHLFCDLTCYRAWTKPGKNYECDRCGKPIIVGSWDSKNRKQHFCSKECRRLNSMKGKYVPCDNCGKEVYRTPYRLEHYKRQFCCSSCRNKWMSIHQVGKNCPAWRGGIYNSPDGYVYLNVGHGKRVAKHRLIMEKHLGRKLDTKEEVHHINGIRDDNRLVNLCVVIVNNHERHTLLKQCKRRIIELEDIVKGIYACPN